MIDTELGEKVLRIGWAHGQSHKYLEWPWTGSGVAPSIYSVPKFQYRLVQEESPPVKRVIPLGFCYWGELEKQYPTRSRSYSYRPHMLTSEVLQ